MADAYIVAPKRTAVGKADRGTLAQFRPDDMAAAVVKDVLATSGAPADAVQDLVLGCAFPEGAQGMNVARIVQARAGLPDGISCMTLNRLCSSGLESIAILAAKIKAGLLDLGIAGGVESMSMIPMGGHKYSPNPDLTRERPEVYIGMGHCGDNVARDFGYSREELDAWALRSHQRAVNALDKGYFTDEITPLEVPAGANGGTRTFTDDEGPRRDTNPEALARLKPAFSLKGFCTAGNSSQKSDGAAAVMVASEKAVAEYNLQPVARFLGYNVAGNDPKYLGPAQLDAIPKALELSGIGADDLDLIENNEAFASQCIHVVRGMGFDEDKVNVNGGAIALGHPLGCTGAKLSVQILHALRRSEGRYGLVTMCIGGGMGAAGVYEMV
jgi:acetyl-CoA acyltransferase